MKTKEIRTKKINELKTLLEDTSKEFFKTKMQVVTGQLMTHRQLRELRKRIAIIKTVIREKEINDERSYKSKVIYSYCVE